jgi:hypothetical protein
MGYRPFIDCPLIGDSMMGCGCGCISVLYYLCLNLSVLLIGLY